MVCGIKGGNANYPCPYGTYFQRTGSFPKMFQLLHSRYFWNESQAEQCCGVRSSHLLKFSNPLLAFPIAVAHAQLGLREKLDERIPRGILRELANEYPPLPKVFVLQKNSHVPRVTGNINLLEGGFLARYISFRNRPGSSIYSLLTLPV